MRESKVMKGTLLNKNVLKVIDELRELSGKEPGAESARVALQGMLEGLIRQAESGEGNIERIVEELIDLGLAFPESPLPWRHLSQVWLDREEWKRARAAADQGLKVEPGDVELVNNRAVALGRLGDHEAAIVGFKHCIEREPRNTAFYCRLGDTYRQLKMYEQAEQALHQALEIDPRCAPALLGLAVLNNDREEWAGCVYFGELALRYLPGHPETCLVVGDALLNLHEYEAALQRLMSATLVDPTFIGAYELMSHAYAELGMYELSVGAAREALRLNPESWRALVNVAYALGKQERHPQSADILEAALKLVPDVENRCEVLWDLGWACYKAGRYKRALACTEQALECGEQPDLILFFNRGLILLALGRVDEAEEAYQKAVERAQAEENHDVLAEASENLGELLARKAVKIKSGSVISRLLEG
ncbi:MAG: lipoprotein NlpI [Chloroflexi bacterium ADurb.Bin180]|nr:MAG: lipoprotein NlpI [Chloroflexi bacterium ADurb.Bin180]